MSASFDAYKIFYYVGKYNNITHAANALFLSQSTVSRSIQSLESDLGCKLMERSQHGVSLTAEGQMLYSHVALAYDQIMAGEESIKRLGALRDRQLRIGADSFVFSRFILPLMKDFRKDFPDIRVEIMSDCLSDQDKCAQALMNDELDLVFTQGHLPDSPDLVSVPLGEYSDVFIAGRAFPEFYEKRSRLYDLSLQNFGSLRSGIGGRDYLVQSFAMHGLRVEPQYEVENFDQLLSLVESGLCLALVPSPLLDCAGRSESIFPITINATLNKKNLNILSARNTPQNIPRDELIKRVKKIMHSISG